MPHPTVAPEPAVQPLYLDGTWVPTTTWAPVRNPWNDTEIGRYAIADPTHLERAVTAARRALSPGPPAHRRAAVLRAVASRVGADSEQFAQCISAEAGKPITAARAEVSRAVDTLLFSAEAARGLGAATVPMDATAAGTGLIAFELPVPRGVVAAVTPFNFPLNLVAHKVGPALAAGCPVLLKPSEKTPLTASLLVSAFHDAGLEPGMLNLVTGDPKQLVDALVADPRIAVLTFTGSTAVGWDIAARAPRKHLVLELGSNTAMVVTRTADLDRAAAAAVSGGFTYAGQACVSVQRVYVDAAVEADFLDRLTAAARAVPVGDPADPCTVVGPTITHDARDRMLDWIATAVAEGATLLTGGRAEGNTVMPTVLSGVPRDSRILCDEAFAPVVCVNGYTDLDAAIAEVNRSRFALNTAIFTADLDAALRYARQAEAGTVMVNVSPSFRADHMPYGGVKESGRGREGVPYAVREMLDTRLVVLAPSGL